jgi:hypothetical protein
MENYTFAKLKLEIRGGLKEQEDLWRTQQILSVLLKNFNRGLCNVLHVNQLQVLCLF